MSELLAADLNQRSQLVRTRQILDLVDLAKHFFTFAAGRTKNPDGTERPIQGYHTLPEGTLKQLHVITALIVAHDGTIYATTTYPFTLLRIETVKAAK